MLLILREIGVMTAIDKRRIKNAEKLEMKNNKKKKILIFSKSIKKVCADKKNNKQVKL